MRLLKYQTLSLFAIFALGIQTAYAQQVTEGFEVSFPAAGWDHQNRSAPAGPTPWDRYLQNAVLAHGGTHFAMSDYLAAANGGTISDWLITPEVTIVDGVTLTFWTKSEGGGTFADRMQVRLSTAGASLDVGTTATSVGAFTTLLLDINEGLSPTGYPTTYTAYTVTVTGVATATTGRFAFRYFLTNAGTNGAAVVLDDVEISSLCGNGVTNSGEACDDGNATNGDGCDANCTVTACGNGVVAGTEVCDDGNAANGDGCEADCSVTPSAACGDGRIAGAEACDDGNATDDDGCDGGCIVETGWSCSGVPSTCAPVCGDGEIVDEERCDDGNGANGDGCSRSCLVEAGGCTVVVPPSARGSVLVMLGFVGLDLLRRTRRRRRPRAT